MRLAACARDVHLLIDDVVPDPVQRVDQRSASAPDIEDPEDWESLTPKGLDALTANTITGVGDMAARGACAECTDEEIRAAVEYMLGNLQ